MGEGGKRAEFILAISKGGGGGGVFQEHPPLCYTKLRRRSAGLGLRGGSAKLGLRGGSATLGLR